MLVSSCFPDEIQNINRRTGIEMYRKGDFSLAEEMLQSALHWAESYNNCVEKKIEIINNLGVIAYARNDYLDAAHHFQEAMALIETQLSFNFINLPLILSNYSTSLRILGHEQEALGLENCLNQIMENDDFKKQGFYDENYLAIDNLIANTNQIKAEVA